MMRVAAAILLAAVACTGVRGKEPGSRSTDEIAALIEAAEKGATIVVPPGVYHGHLRIKKPVRLEGGGLVTIDGGGEGTVVELLVPEVHFRGFVVRGSGSGVDHEPAAIRAEAGPVSIENNRVEDALFGIDLRTASGSLVRNNVISGKDLAPGRRGDGIRLWWSHDSRVIDNRVRGSRDLVFWYSENLEIRGNTVEDSRYGLHFMYSHRTTLSDNRLSGNSVGVYLMYSNIITIEGNTLERNRGPSGYGIGLKECDDIEIRGNRIIANRVGIYADNTPVNVGGFGHIADNLLAFNEIGMLMTPSTRSQQIWGNGFVENEQQVTVHGRGDLLQNTFGRDGRGNFWSDYAGYDRAGDGVGDLAYRSQSLFEDLLAREPNLRLFVHSPAQQAIEFTARAVPVVLPAPKLVDEHPLMSPPVVRGVREPARSGAGMVAVCAALLAAGSAVVFLGRGVPGGSDPEGVGRS